MKNRKEILSNFPYIIWVLFYAFLFWLIFGATMESLQIVVVIYAVSLILACTPVAEWLWRMVSGVRKLATLEEKDRLLPLFGEVYEDALKIDGNLFKNIELCTQDSMEINAFAFGQRTLILTRGAIEMLDDEALKGIIAHEFGHFSHYDTVVTLFAHISNILMGIFLKFVYGITKTLMFIARNKDPIIGTTLKIFYKIVIGIYKAIVFIGDLILMPVSRKHEHLADIFATKCGYGKNLIYSLYQLRQISLSEPTKLIEQLRSTHPPLVKRIEVLENLK